MTTVPLIQVTIRRDANTITPVTVPPYELTILRNMFGKENVTEGEQVGTYEVEANGEHERLSAKYGQGKVIKVYGDDDGERLSELVEKAAVKVKAPTKAEKAAAKEEAGANTDAK
jgi:hypothetical protein